MRYLGPLPFPVRTLGDVWDLSVPIPPRRHLRTLGDFWDLPDVVIRVLEMREREQEEEDMDEDDEWTEEDDAEEGWRQYRYAKNQVLAARKILDDLERALEDAVRLREFRQEFRRITNSSHFYRG
jgi:hypothetical protein